ncbi:MAG: nascent polypeptide-associated complex protein [Candidatus Woesearchaeota archaeon]
MFPGVNPRQMQQMMKKMGIQQVEIPAVEVIIRTADKELVIKNPTVSKVNMMGQETFQISGEVEEREQITTPQISAEDIKMVMEQTEVNKETAEQTLKKHKGDLAETILDLKKEE